MNILSNINIITYISIISLCIYLVNLIKNPSKYRIKVFVLGLAALILMALDSFNILNLKAFKYILLLSTVIIPMMDFTTKLLGKDIKEYITIFLANTYIGADKRKKAKNILNKYLEDNPNSYLARRELANIYKEEGGMRRAIEEYVKVIELNRKDYKSLYAITTLLDSLDKTTEAEELLKHLIEIKEDYIEAYELLADILANSDRHKEAAAVYEHGVKNNPESYDLTYNLAAEYVELTSLDKAELTLKRALELSPNNYICIYNLAQLNYIFGNLKEAEEMFTKTLEHPSLEASSYFELAKIAKTYGRKEKAVAYLNNALSLNNDLMARLNEEELFDDIKEETIVSVNLTDKNNIGLDSLEPKVLKVIANLENTANLIGVIAKNTRKENTENLVDEMLAEKFNVDKLTLNKMKKENTKNINEKIQNIERIVDKYIEEDKFLNLDTAHKDGKHDEVQRTRYIPVFKRTYKPYDISEDQRIKNIEESYNENKLELKPDKYILELEKKINEKRRNILFLKDGGIDKDDDQKEKDIFEEILNTKIEHIDKVESKTNKEILEDKKQEVKNKINKNNEDLGKTEEEILKEEQEKIDKAKEQVFLMLDRIKKDKEEVLKQTAIEEENEKIDENKDKENKEPKEDKIKRNRRVPKVGDNMLSKEEKLDKKVKDKNEEKTKDESLKRVGEFYANYKGYGYISEKTGKKLEDKQKDEIDTLEERKNIEDEKLNNKIEYVTDEIQKEKDEKREENKVAELYKNMLYNNLQKIKENQKKEELEAKKEVKAEKKAKKDIAAVKENKKDKDSKKTK